MQLNGVTSARTDDGCRCGTEGRLPRSAHRAGHCVQKSLQSPAAIHPDKERKTPFLRGSRALLAQKKSSCFDQRPTFRYFHSLPEWAAADHPELDAAS